MTSTTRTTTVRSSSGDGQSIYVPKSAPKTVIVQRGTIGGRSGRSSMYGGYGGSSSYSRLSSSINPAVYSQMASSGIADFRSTRVNEKRDMQDCNERLATYIEQVRWLEAQNKKLEAENEALRKRKQEDWRPIREMYEAELNQAREVIKDMSSEKGVYEAKLAGLQDEIDSLKDFIATYENNAKDYAKKIDQLNSQIGEYEGELTTLRLRVGSLEDECAKLRALINKYKDENARLRADLDAETAAHIEQEVLAQTRLEELQFLQEVLDKLQLVDQEPVTVKGLDMEQFFKGELRQAIQAIQQTYDEKMDQMTMECESRVASQMNQLKSGNIRDSMELDHSKSEMKRIRDQLAEKNARIAALESELAVLRAEKQSMAIQLGELQTDFDKLSIEHDKKMAEFQMQLEAQMQQLQELIDAKMSLELEIACYKKLLEGEENRTGLRQLVEQTIGVRGGGASQLAGIIGGGQSSSTTSRMEVQKNRTGMLGFKSLDPSGSCIEVELDAQARTAQDLKNVKLVKKVGGSEKFSIDLSKLKVGRLEGGRSIKVFTTSAKQSPDNDSEMVCNEYNFGFGPAEYYLLDGQRQVASLIMRQGY